MKKHITVISIIAIAVTALFAVPKPFFKPKDGYVPDEQTAISIAIAVLKPVYGEENIENQKPFEAKLTDGVWGVEGHLPRGSLGGVAHVEIIKNDGQIRNMWHTQ